MIRCILAVLVMLSATALADERPITVIIPAYNNAAYVKATLESVFQQQYSNYHIIYIDDCSTDGSLQKVQSIINQCNRSESVTLIQNQKRHRKLKNIFYAIHWYCDDDDIIFMLDCDDTLAHKGVFKHINNLYSNDTIWMTYGQDKPTPEDVARRWGLPLKGNCCATPEHVITSNSFRQFDFVYMHPRTFKAWLFKAIAVDDLLSLDVPNYRGQFYPACNDYAMYYPMLEMAGRHTYFNSTLLYIYNCGSPLNGFKIDRTLQTMSAQEIRKIRKKYTPIAQPIKTKPVEANNDLHVLLISTSADQTDLWIQQSLPKNFCGAVTVITHSDQDADKMKASGMNTLCSDEHIPYGVDFPEFMCIAVDTDIPSHALELDRILTELRITQSFAYVWNLDASQVIHQELAHELHVAQIAVNPQLAQIKTGGIYRSSDVVGQSHTTCMTIGQILKQWQSRVVDPLRTVIVH